MNRDTVIAASVLFLFVGAVAAGSFIKVPQPVTKEVTKTKQVPVEEQITRTEPTQVTKTVELSYRLVDCRDATGLTPPATAEAEIRNTDTEPGTYTVEFTFDLAGPTYTRTDRVYVQPGETGTASAELETDLFQDVAISCSVEPGTKEITVTEQQTVTETVTRTETKEYTEEVTKTKQVPLYQVVGSSITAALTAK